MNNNFNPNEAGINNGNYFGFPFSPEESKIVLISVPWDVTTSYKPGTSRAPQAIIEASTQLDFYDFDVEEAWKIGYGTIPISENIIEENRKLREYAVKVINHLENAGSTTDETISDELGNVNEGSKKLNDFVYHSAREWINKDKLVGLVGGEHSIPFGYIKALSEKYDSFGILQIDAHADLRDNYEGFEFSHASIMNNVMKLDPISSLVQVGIRDICEEEIEAIEKDDRIKTFNDFKLKEDEFAGVTWKDQCGQIINELPGEVYISFDIDGLGQEFCPNTGTPVPGGISFNKAVYLIKSVVNSGRKIIGFDLSEVGVCEKSDWDANVGARILYKLANLMFLSQQK